MGVNVAVTANAAEAANPTRGAVFFFRSSFVLVILAPRRAFCRASCSPCVKMGANARYPATFPQVGYGPSAVCSARTTPTARIGLACP